eukprot:SAG11_NODE_10352_length_837_cov_1.794038_1_plen_68_part_10
MTLGARHTASTTAEYSLSSCHNVLLLAMRRESKYCTPQERTSSRRGGLATRQPVDYKVLGMDGLERVS